MLEQRYGYWHVITDVNAVMKTNIRRRRPVSELLTGFRKSILPCKNSVCHSPVGVKRRQAKPCTHKNGYSTGRYSIERCPSVIPVAQDHTGQSSSHLLERTLSVTAAVFLHLLWMVRTQTELAACTNDTHHIPCLMPASCTPVITSYTHLHPTYFLHLFWSMHPLKIDQNFSHSSQCISLRHFLCPFPLHHCTMSDRQLSSLFW